MPNRWHPTRTAPLGDVPPLTSPPAFGARKWVRAVIPNEGHSTASDQSRHSSAPGRGKNLCRERINLAGLGDTSCGRSFSLCPAEERCLRRRFPGETVRTISRSRPAARARTARRGCQGWPRLLRGHRIAARSVLDSPEHGASLTAGRAGGLSFGALHARGADWNALVVVASEATASMENRQPTVRILMHLHRRPDEVRTQRALRYL
jgi:hypothetical protein